MLPDDDIRRHEAELTFLFLAFVVLVIVVVIYVPPAQVQHLLRSVGGRLVHLLPGDHSWPPASWERADSLKAINHLKPADRLKAADHVHDGKYHLLLAATGSVATIKLPNILQALSEYDNLSVRVLLSSSAAEFLQGQSSEQPSLAQISKIKNVDAIYRDEDEWSKPWVRGDNILHIELRRWADLMVVAPLSANSLAKLALGMSDNLVSSVARAWDGTGLIDGGRDGIILASGSNERPKKIILVAPAMNTAMWNHPVTQRHLSALDKDWGVEHGGWFKVLWPIDKGLACGDKGGGAMKEWKEIVAAIEQRFPDLVKTKLT